MLELGGTDSRSSAVRDWKSGSRSSDWWRESVKYHTDWNRRWTSSDPWVGSCEGKGF